MNHIDPGDPPIDRSYHPDMADEHAERPVRRNTDPINAWRPGLVSAQREAHFRPEGGGRLGGRNPHAVGIHVTQAEMGRMPEVGGPNDYTTTMPRVERDGPNYSGQAEVERPLLLDLGMPADVITPRAQWILEQCAMGALREFVRYNLQYGDTDQALGYQGQFAEMFHITAKLKRLVWDQRNPATVTRQQVMRELESMIGHALLALDLLDKENKDGRS